MPSTDDRIVSMQFNNANFERRIADTVKSLGELKKSLDFANSGNSLRDVTAAANSFNLNGIATAIDGISNKFSAMGAVAFSVINSITAKALSFGAQIASSFTINPVSSGFKEYETNINSIQTILANTKSAGTNLEDVTAALDELNLYADKTIYNFAEMARNIGTFTAAGVDLDTSVNAIKGIANLAALSGSSATQASTAMYQLSQAIAAGRVTLIDWNSVVNAGIGGEVFKNALFETAKALGTIEGISLDTTFEQWEDAGNLFRNSLQGDGIAIDATATAVEAATAKGLKSLEDARERAAENAESANRRVADAEESLAEVITSSAEAITNAEEQRAESAINNSKAIVDAEKAQVDVFEDTALSIERAVKEQSDSVEEGAINVKKALDGVVDAQERLQEALKPASTDELGEATDNLSKAQLDQADLSRSITDAQKDQIRATEVLRKANIKLRDVQLADPTNFEAIGDAYQQVEDAQKRVTDLADAQERARISQNEGTRAVTRAEEELAKVKIKGTEADDKVISARSALEEATQRLADIQEESNTRQQNAIKGLADAQETSDERRTTAIENVANAKKRATEDEIKYNEQVAEAVENSSKRQADATRTLQDSQKANTRTVEDNIALIETARANAERAVDEAAAASGEAPSWLTSEVLTTALSSFTGDLTEAQLMALGYTEAQAKEMIELGKLASDSATEVKTLTQLLGTVRENITSGWAQSFRTLFGDFDQAKDAYTSLNNTIKDIIDPINDARNAMLAKWADPEGLNGRAKLIEGIKNAFEALTSVLNPIKEAFREIFPKQTAESLLLLTERFRKFTASLKISSETGEKIGQIFRGFFAVFEIGITILKNVAKFIGNVFTTLSDSAGGNFLNFFAEIGDAFTNLNKILVTDGGIDTFFDGLNTTVGNFVGNIGQFISELGSFSGSISDLFNGFKAGLSGVIDADAEGLVKFVNDLGLAISNLWNTIFGGDDTDASVVGEGIDRVGERLSALERIGKALADMWDTLTSKSGIFGQVITELGNFLSQAFAEIGNAIAGAFDEESFDETLDLVNTGLFAGLVALIGKFVTTGLKIDFGANLAKNLSEGLGKLTDVLGAMQANLRAEALQKIAIAIAVLAGALFILAAIDSGDLAKALTAVAVGFGQLVGTLAVLAQVSTGKQSVGLAALAGGMVAIAGAALILAGALLLISTIDVDKLPTAVLALTGVLTALGGAAAALAQVNAGISFIAVGIGIVAIATATVILAGALVILSTLTFEEITNGLIAMAGALIIIAGAVALMPVTLPIIGAGLILVSIGLVAMSVAILAFAAIDLGTLATGLFGIVAALVAIALGMSLMPLTLPLTAAGLILVGIALTTIVASIALLGGLSWESLAKGIGGVAAILFVLALAAAAMSGSLLGAIAIGIMSVSLLALTAVLKGLATLSIAELAIGLAAIAASLAVFGIAAALLQPILPAMLLLGAALLLIGAAFLAFGVGAALAAQAFAIFATVGAAGFTTLIEGIGAVLVALPTFVNDFVSGILKIADTLLDAAPELSKKFFELLTVLIRDLIKILPVLGQALIEIIDTAITVITAQAPKIIALGFFLINEFLTQLRANIGEIVTIGIDIITNFIDGITQGIPQLVESGAAFIVAFLQGIAERATDIVTAGADLIIAILEGIAERLDDVIVAGGEVTIALLEGIGRNAINLVGAAVGLVVDFIEAIGENLNLVLDAGADLVISIANGIADRIDDIVTAGTNIVIELFNSMEDNVTLMTDAGADLLIAVLNAIGDDVDDIATAASNLVIRVVNALYTNLDRMRDAGKNLLKRVMWAIGDDIPEIADAAFDLVTRVLNGLAKVVRERSGELQSAGRNLAGAVLDGMTFGLASKAGGVFGFFGELAGGAVQRVQDTWEVDSPSKVFRRLAEFAGEGMILGVQDSETGVVKSFGAVADSAVDSFGNALKKIPNLEYISDANPKITPVLDLSNVKRYPGLIKNIFDEAPILTAGISTEQANQISESNRRQREAALIPEDSVAYPFRTENVKFEQNIYAPVPLSPGEIYRQTRSQFALAKEELSIP